MQLDKTGIAIRERGLLEILDLSLQVIRRYALPLLAATVVGALPLMLLNWWLIGWMISPQFEGWGVFSYICTMTMLVIVEAPVASIPATLYLGDAMFHQPTGVRRIATDAAKLFPRLLLCQGVFRGVLPTLLCVAFLGDEEVGMADVGPLLIFLLVCLMMYVTVIRAVRPYLGEIVLLERNPVSSRNSKTITIGRRSAALHNPNSGDLLGRWLGAASFAVMMAVAFVFAAWSVPGWLRNDWDWSPAMMHVYMPLSMWLVAGYFGVVRFLSYLDLRIRREGWEVELIVRAEAARMVRSL